MKQIILGLLLTILPITELRVGLPVILEYVLSENLPIWPFFILTLEINILVIFLIFFFLDHFHKILLNWKLYRKLFEKVLKKIQLRGHKLEKQFKEVGWLSLILFVAAPLPGTGAWTGTLLAWILGLDRKKSVLSISIGVIISGILILLASLGIFSLV